MHFSVIIFIVSFCAVSAFSLKDEPQCQAPNGGGITPIIKEFIYMLPFDKIFGIYLNAVNNDQEVQDVMAYLESHNFHEILSNITNSSEFTIIVQITCDKLYLDIIFYINLINKVFGIPIISRPVQMKKDLNRHMGFHGLILDVMDVIDINVLKKLLIQKSKSDEYVEKAFDIIKSQTFKNYFTVLYNTPAYSQMLTEFGDMGVNVDPITDLIHKYLGW